MTADRSGPTRWTVRVTAVVDVLTGVALAGTSVFFLSEFVHYSRLDEPVSYAFEAGMSFAISGLCGLLALILLVASRRRTAYAFGFAAAGWVLACLPVSVLLSSVVHVSETPAWLLVLVLLVGVGSNVAASRASHPSHDVLDAPARA